MSRVGCTIAATVVLLAVAPAPALSAGRSSLATVTAVGTAAAFALCAGPLQRQLLAAVVVLCGPPLKAMAVAATAAEGPAAAATSHAIAQDAAVSAFIAVMAAVPCLCATRRSERAISASAPTDDDADFVIVSGVDAGPVQKDTHSMAAHGTASSSRKTARAVTKTTTTLLVCVFSITLVLLVRWYVSGHKTASNACSSVVRDEWLSLLSAVFIAVALPTSVSAVTALWAKRQQQVAEQLSSAVTHSVEKTNHSMLVHEAERAGKVYAVSAVVAALCLLTFASADLLTVSRFAVDASSAVVRFPAALVRALHLGDASAAIIPGTEGDLSLQHQPHVTMDEVCRIDHVAALVYGPGARSVRPSLCAKALMLRLLVFIVVAPLLVPSTAAAFCSSKDHEEEEEHGRMTNDAAGAAV